MKRLLVFATLLTACAGPMVFTKDGHGEKELQYDMYECQQQWERGAQATAFRADPLNNMYYGIRQRDELRACLIHKGWTQS